MITDKEAKSRKFYLELLKLRLAFYRFSPMLYKHNSPVLKKVISWVTRPPSSFKMHASYRTPCQLIWATQKWSVFQHSSIKHLLGYTMGVCNWTNLNTRWLSLDSVSTFGTDTNRTFEFTRLVVFMDALIPRQSIEVCNTSPGNVWRVLEW